MSGALEATEKAPAVMLALSLIFMSLPILRYSPEKFVLFTISLPSPVSVSGFSSSPFKVSELDIVCISLTVRAFPPVSQERL